MNTFPRFIKLIVYAHALVPIVHHTSDAQILVASNGSNQSIGTASKSLKRNYAPLGEVLNKLKSEQGIYFLYKDSKLKQKLVPADLKLSGAAPLTIEKLLASADLTSRKIGNIYIISEAAQHTNLHSVALSEALIKVSVDKKISGKITDEKGEALPGVNVILKGTTVGTTSSADGTYTLTVGDNDQVLIFSFLGYTEQEVTIGNRSSIDISLLPDIKQLTEVVVVGYGTMDKKEVTSAITHISEKELLTVGANNPLMSLQGKVSGLTISNVGAADPNSNPTIQLRGVSSRSAGLGPLVVIDGIPGGNLENLNQNDIASIDVLKDGAASAIYGTRGSNGVIMISTKKGGGGKINVNYNGYASFDLPSRTLKTLSADEFVSIERGTNYGAKTDWFDEITRKAALSQKHSISFFGGDAKTNYRATADYRKAEGLDIRSNRNEYGARLAVNHKSGNGLYEINMNLAPRFFKRNDADYGVFTQALTLNPTSPVMNPNIPNQYFLPDGWEAFNPVERLKTEESGSEAKFLEWNTAFKLNILKSLSTQITIGQNSRDYFDFFFRPSTSTYARAYEGGMSSANRRYSKNDQKSLEWIGDYSTYWNNHSLKLVGGYSYQYFQYSELFAENRNFTSDAFTYNNIGNGVYMQEVGRNGMTTTKNDSKLIAFFGRANYSFKEKYMVTASLRYEGSSKFGFNNKWGYFPAFSAGWRISEESFAKNIRWINDLKIRSDFGITGNQDFGNYLSLDLYAGAGYYPLNGQFYQVWGPGQNTNYNLRWEKAKNYNIGVDFAIFNNKVTGSFNYYNRKQEDLLGYYNVPLPPNIQSTTFLNVGTMRNAGIELQVTAALVEKKDFNYSISFAGATNNNKFVSFSNDLFKGQKFLDVVGMPAPGSPGTTQRLQEGERVGNFYMWKFAGIAENGNFLVYNKDGEVIPSNQAVNDDKRIVGNGLPKFTASLGNTITYKNWDASVFFRGAFGYDIFNVHEFYYGLQAAAANINVLKSAYDRNNEINGPNSVALLTDYFLENGNFLKLDVVTVGYTIKSKSKFYDSLRIYGSTRNLATFTAFRGVDPEAYPINGLYPGILTTSSGGGSKSYYPTTTQLLIGVQFNF